MKKKMKKKKKRKEKRKKDKKSGTMEQKGTNCVTQKWEGGWGTCCAAVPTFQGLEYNLFCGTTAYDEVFLTLPIRRLCSHSSSALPDSNQSG